MRCRGRDGMHILFVDDAPDTCQLFRTGFSLEGHSAEVFDNGYEAVMAVRSTHFDAIVMDISMPRVTGWLAAAEIRKLHRGRDVPLILFTAFDAQEDHQKAEQVGADALLRKPLTPAELLQHIDELSASKTANKPRKLPAPSAGEVRL